MSKLFGGSICLTELNNLAKTGHSAFSRAANGKVYVNINIWDNETEDKFGNTISLQVNPKKDSPDTKAYIGNAKPAKAREPEPIEANSSEFEDDLPF